MKLFVFILLKGKSKILCIRGQQIHGQTKETFSYAKTALSMNLVDGKGYIIPELMEWWVCSDMSDYMSIQKKFMKISEKCLERLFMQKEKQILSFTCNLESNKEQQNNLLEMDRAMGDWG